MRYDFDILVDLYGCLEIETEPKLIKEKSNEHMMVGRVCISAVGCSGYDKVRINNTKAQLYISNFDLGI